MHTISMRVTTLNRSGCVVKCIVSYMLKARTVKPSETAVVRERFCKHALG